MGSRNATSITTRRAFLASGAAATGGLLGGYRWSAAVAAAGHLLRVETRTLEVNKKPAKVFAVLGADGRHGLLAREGDRLSGTLHNGTTEPLQMHWHGQVKAPSDQDRARPGGGALAPGASDTHDFELTAGTHWMHAHTLSEQQLLAAPMVTREKDAGDVQDVVVMLHDFTFRTPEEVLAGLGGKDAHAAHGAGAPRAAGQGSAAGDGHRGSGSGSGSGSGPAAHHGSAGHAGHRPGMVHANDVAYDAYLANDRTLDDPEVVAVEKSGRVRLRIINGATATAFHIRTPGLESRCIAVDGTPCQPLAEASYPLAQGQRIDLLLEIPAGGGAFPVLAQVEAAQHLTGLVLASRGAAVAKLAGSAVSPAGMVDLALEGRLRAARPLEARQPARTFRLDLGEEPGYRWTINGRIHGEHQPLEARQGERVEITFVNHTSMMHPMHLHGHHFQVVAIGGQRFAGPVRDTVIVPPHVALTIAFDAGLKGEWFLHCHHLYHMATGMMTEVRVS